MGCAGESMEAVSKQANLFKYCLIALLFCLIVISRRPDVVTYPQFYAEDGAHWYSEAYQADHFWEPFLVPIQKYYQTVSRVGGLAGNLVDIRYAPLVFNLFAILIQISPALFFLSSRFDGLVPGFSRRLLWGLIYLMLPGTGETHANLTNAMWRLTLLMLLVIIAPAGKKAGWKIFDCLVLLLAGLSGPFVFIAFPLAVLFHLCRKSLAEASLKLGILAVTFLIQLHSFLFIVVQHAQRSDQSLGVSSGRLLKIIAGDVFVRGILGVHTLTKIMSLGIWHGGLLPLMITLAGAGMLGYVLWNARLELKLLIVFSFLILAAGLASPQVSLTIPQWKAMAEGSGERYYFFPILAWVISLGWILRNARLKSFKCVAVVFLLAMLMIGIPKSWVFASYKNHDFARQVQEFKKTGPGEVYKFRIAPEWVMPLVRK